MWWGAGVCLVSSYVGYVDADVPTIAALSHSRRPDMRTRSQPFPPPQRSGTCMYSEYVLIARVGPRAAIWRVRVVGNNAGLRDRLCVQVLGCSPQCRISSSILRTAAYRPLPKPVD